MRPSSSPLWAVLLAAGAVVAATSAPSDPLPSWRDGTSKRTIVDFVQRVTRHGGKDFVAPEDRVAVFDNDGTLWSEQPAYFQLLFVLDRVRALAPAHPEWRQTQPFQAAIEGDVKALIASGEHGLLELLMVTHAGMTTEEFAGVAREWLATARHPKSGRAYTDMVFQPMLEVLAYLRSNGFATYIVSGGGIEFLRAFSQPVYGVPPQNVVGSSIKTRYEVRDGKPAIVRLPEIDFVDDKAGKPVGIHKFIGKRPIAAFGNSDGDFEMLEWTTSGTGLWLAVLVRHDDADREFAYDRDSHVGKLSRGLDEAPRRGWTVVSMKNDWNSVYPTPRK